MRQDVSRYQRVDEALPPSEQLLAKGFSLPAVHKGDRQIRPMGPGGEGGEDWVAVIWDALYGHSSLVLF